MNEGDFDKLFNDKFKDFEGSDFSTIEWGGLENRLNKRDNWRKILLWLLPLLLLSALAGGWFYTWYQLQQMRMNVPNSSYIDNTRSHKDTLQDTIIRRTIIYQNDTIYRKILLIYQQQLLNPNQPTLFQNKINDVLKDEKTHSDKIIHLNPTIVTTNSDTSISSVSKNRLHPNPKTDKSIEQKPFINESGTPNTTNIRDEARGDSNPKETNQTNNIKMPLLSKGALMDSISDKKGNDTIQKVANVIPEPEKKVEELEEKTADKELKPIIKRELRIPSVFLGFVAAKPWNLEKDYSELKGSQIGIRAEVEASNNLSIITELNYGQGKIESKTGNTLPTDITIPEPIPSYLFQYWAVNNLKTLNYIGALQYKFKGNRSLRPYIAVGINGHTVLPYELQFEYYNSQNDTEKYIKQKVTSSTTHVNQIYGAGGVQWHPLSRWRFLAEGFVSYPLKNTPLRPRQMGIKVATSYMIIRKRK